MLFAFLVLLPFYAYSEDLGMIRLSLIEGDVQAMIQDTADWSAATINLPLNEGDRLWAPDDSKAELQLRGGVYVRAGADTALDILTISVDSAQFYLDRGHVYINNRRGGIQTVQIDTPQSSIRSYDNSIMFVDVTEDGVVEISMLKGFAYAESRAGATRVSAGNTLTIRGENGAEIAPISSPDEWEQWNTERDRRLTAWSDSSRYLPDELHEYSADLDANGRWEYVSDYGYVWRPTIVAADWAPYTVGNWVWIRGHYVWIAHDPWGWVPSHYGRWVYIASYGWSWVPPTMGAAYWSPGYVGWVVTPDYVAWVPLAPGEIYYGYGYYGPWSRNIATINVNTVVVNRTYINARASNSVVAVRRDSFGTGRRNPVRIAENPFVDTQRRQRENIAIAPPPGRPQQPIVIAPERRDPVSRRPLERQRVRPETTENRHVAPAVPSPQPAARPERPVAPPSPPVVQQQPTGRQTPPPEQYRRIRPQEMKNDRRVVREREASVFRAQPPDNLTVRKLNEPRVIPRKPVQQPQKKKSEEGKENRRERQQSR
jgi:hypothetical protein